LFIGNAVFFKISFNRAWIMILERFFSKTERSAAPEYFKAFLHLFVFFLLSFILCGLSYAGSGKYAEKLKSLKLAGDVRIDIFYADAERARHMAFDDQGILFLSQMKKGKVVALPDSDADGKADRSVEVHKGRNPHGLAFARQKTGYYLYVAEETRVVRMKRIGKPYSYGPPETFIDGIPGGGHYSRTIKIRDGKLYLSVGSSCNVCEEKSKIRAAIARFNLNGKGGGIFAEGLRNSVGIEFSPYSGELWGVNNGRDMLGDDHPREELNIIRKGRHYGWPYCYEDRVFDKDFDRPFDCSKTEAPALSFTAHMAPLGLAFYKSGTLPARYDNSLFIAFHGSWNRSVPAGYKVVRVKLDAKGKMLGHEDFISGWLKENGQAWGRPVDLEQSPKGDLYLSDDHLGVIYRITGK